MGGGILGVWRLVASQGGLWALTVVMGDLGWLCSLGPHSPSTWFLSCRRHSRESVVLGAPAGGCSVLLARRLVAPTRSFLYASRLQQKKLNNVLTRGFIRESGISFPMNF